jgi:hypothetical protein
MFTYANNGKGNNKQSAASVVSSTEKKRNATARFVDNRPQIAAQRRLQEMANNHSDQHQPLLQKKQNNEQGNTLQFHESPDTNKINAGTSQEVVQLKLYEDLKNGSVNAVMAGEYHGQLNTDEEIEQWKKIGVKVYYESDTLSYRNMLGTKEKMTPDPVIMRLSYIWTEFARPIIHFWKAYINTGDFTGSEFDYEKLVETYGRLNDEIDLLELVDPLIVEVKDAFAEMNRFFPNSEAKLLGYDPGMRKIVAQAQLSYISILSRNIRAIHQGSSHQGTGFTAEDTMAERSRQMIVRMNQIAGNLNNTIYKVGNEHVVEMGLMGIAPAAGLHVIDKDEYLKEFKTLKTHLLVGNEDVFDSITEDML